MAVSTGKLLAVELRKESQSWWFCLFLAHVQGIPALIILASNFKLSAPLAGHDPAANFVVIAAKLSRRVDALCCQPAPWEDLLPTFIGVRCQ